MKKFLIGVCFLIGLKAFAQVEPVYSQYMFNPVVINPAYVGVHDMASVYGMFRQQWVNFNSDYNPRTATISAQTTLPKNNLGVGLSYVNDRIGFQTTNEFNAMLAYKLPLGSKSLSFGIQGGVMSANFDYDALNLEDETDELYFNGQGDGAGVAPTIGFGALYNTKRLFLGFSMPRVLEMKFEDGAGTEENPAQSRIDRNIMITGGYVFHLSKGVKLKPSTLIRYTEGEEGFSEGRATYDVNMSILLKESIWAGVSFRSFNTCALMGQLKISQMLTTGLAWEFPIDSKNFSQVGSTFEIMLNLNTTLFDVQAVQTVFY